MSAIRVFLAVLSVVLFAGSAARSDEPTKAAKERLAFFDAPVGADEIAALLRERGIKHVARVPLFSAIFVWGTDEEILNVITLIST